MTMFGSKKQEPSKIKPPLSPTVVTPLTKAEIKAAKDELEAIQEASQKAWALRVSLGKAKKGLQAALDAQVAADAQAKATFDEAAKAAQAVAGKMTEEARTVYRAALAKTAQTSETAQGAVNGAQQELDAYAKQFESEYGEQPFGAPVASGGRTRL